MLHEELGIGKSIIIKRDFLDQMDTSEEFEQIKKWKQ